VQASLSADARADLGAPTEPPEEAEPRSAAVNPRAQNTWFGSTGGVRIIDAASGEPGTLRFQLGVDYFRSKDFLVPHDTNEMLSGTFSLSATVIKHLELFAAFSARSNSNDAGNPVLLQVVGDVVFGIKGYAAITRWLSAGADLRVLFSNTVGDLGVTFDATSLGLRPALTADFTSLERPFPLILRANVGYLLNNSSELAEKVERERYNALPEATRRPWEDEDRHLLTRIERFGLQIDRVDTFSVGVGAEVPIQLARDFYLQPLVEWELGIPVNRQRYDCLLVPTDATVDGSDGCLATTGLSAARSTLTAGFRVLPPVRGLSVLVAGDIGLLGTNKFVRELAPNRPWAVMLALAYAIDTRPPKPEVRYVSVPQPAKVVAPPAKVRIDGVVVERGTATPVIAAVIRYPDRELSPQLTGSEGRFLSYEFEPGEVALDVTHPDYDPERCVAQIPAPSELETSAEHTVPLRCELTLHPRPGSLVGTVTDEREKPVAGVRVELTGPKATTLVSSPTGELRAEDLPAGEYRARVDAPEYLFKSQTFMIASGSETRLSMSLITKPKVAHVALNANEVKITTQVVFTPNSAEIDARSTGLLSEVADVLARNPQVERVQVQGHTDNRGAREYNLDLSQRRAEAVMTWLVNAGIDSSRLEAKGFGDERPLVPNLTPDNRARNRRVQFVIINK